MEIEAKKKRGKLGYFLIGNILLYGTIVLMSGIILNSTYIGVICGSLLGLFFVYPAIREFTDKGKVPYSLSFDDDNESLNVKYWYKFNKQQERIINYKNLKILENDYVGISKAGRTGISNIQEFCFYDGNSFVCEIRFPDHQNEEWTKEQVDKILLKSKKISGVYK